MIKTFVEMLHIRFAAPEQNGSGVAGVGSASLNQLRVDPGQMMKLVSRNAKRGAQFTTQGILRWPLTSSRAEDVLAETRSLLTSLGPS